MLRKSQEYSNDSKARMIALGLAQDELGKRREQARQVRPTLGTSTWTVDAIPGLVHPARFKLTTSASPGMPKLTRLAVEVAYDDAGGKVRLATEVKSP